MSTKEARSYEDLTRSVFFEAQNSVQAVDAERTADLRNSSLTLSSDGVYQRGSVSMDTVCPVCNRPITAHMETAIRKVGDAIERVHRTCQGDD